ncbi:Zinc/iron permease [Scleroderma citrinum]
MFSNGLQSIGFMSMVMGLMSYCVGLVPLSVTLSRAHLSILSVLSTGLLIGTALGVIIPEGIEETVSHDPRQGSLSAQVATPVLLGFAFMLLVEEYFTSDTVSPTSRDNDQVFQIDLEQLEREEGVIPDRSSQTTSSRTRSDGVHRAYPLSLGLAVHALVDGYALGVAASNEHSPALSLIVFLAIIVHKAPTALALTTSLLSKSLSVAQCKRHLLMFSLATPTSAILTYILYSLPFMNQRLDSSVPLLFSGGTFLYVATVLQNTSDHVTEPSPILNSKVRRTCILVAGMFFPLLVSQFLGHDH